MSVFSVLRSAAVVLLLCAAIDAGASVGIIQFSAGDVKIRNASGQLRAAVKGGTVEEGDTILTASAASAQLKMSDGGIIAVRPETELKVDTYRYAGKEDGNERAVMSLVKGGFRTITGLIGRTNKQNYTVQTPTAVIGIRGTDHEPMVIPAIVVPGQPSAPAGTYDKVNVGQAFIRTPLGEVNIRQNQVGYAAPNQTPTLLPKVPEFFKATPPVKQAQATKEGEQKQESGGSQSSQASSAEKSADTQSTQTASGSASSESSPASSSSSSTSSESSGGSEIRSNATVDAAPSTASTGSTATTTAVVPTTTTVAPVVSSTSTTTAIAAPAVVQEVKGTSSGSSLSLNLTSQTTTTSSGATTTITETTATTSATSPPSVAAATYGNLVMSQAPADTTTTELEALSFQPQPQSAYLLDTSKALLEIRHTGHATTNAQGLARSIADADLKFSGGSAADVYVDDTSTFYIGRRAGGTITVTDNSGANAPIIQSLNSSSAHWLLAVQPSQTALPGGVGTISTVQNVTGVANYDLAAATQPSDLNGNLGTLKSAVFLADFSNQTVLGALTVGFSKDAGAPKSNRDLELVAVASNVPIKRGGFEAIAGTSTAPSVICLSGDCAEQLYRGTIRGMFGATSGNSGGVGSGLGVAYSFAPSSSSAITFEDLIQGTAVLSNTGAVPTAGVQPSFANNANVRHELFYDTLQKGSSTNGNFATARDAITLSSGTALSGPRQNTNYLFDSSGNLVRIYDTPYAIFDHGSTVAGTSTAYPAPTPIANAQISMGGFDSTASDLYADSTLGLRMGRWTGGALNVTDIATGNGYIEALGDRSVHWLVRAAPTSLPVSGVYHYSKVAATQPTDMYGNVGTLDRARLGVDFTRSTVSAGVAITMPTGPGGGLGTQWLSGYFTDVPLSSSGFNVSSSAGGNAPNTDQLHVSCFGSGCAASQTYGGRIRGGFSSGTAAANTAEGAYFRYSFVTNYPNAAAADAESRVFDDYIDGFVAFKQGPEIAKPSFDIMGTPAAASSVVKPAGDASIVYAYNYLNGSFLQSRIEDLYAEGGKGYEVDGLGRLVSAQDYFDDDDRRISASNPVSGIAKKIQVGTGGNAFDVAYGHYVQPTLAGKDFEGNFTNRLANTFHWVRGPAIYPFYLSMIAQNPANLSTSSTAVAYAYLGGGVTDALGSPGTIDSAGLKVNFSTQTVDASVKATVGNGTGTSVFNAVANGIALEDLGSFSARSNGSVRHNFAGTGSELTVTTNNVTTSASGSLEGSLMGPGVQAAGFVLDFTAPAARATGSVVFGNPTYTDTSGANVPFSVSPLTDYRFGMVASGMNKVGALTNSGGSVIEQEGNYRVDLGMHAPNRVQFADQTINGATVPALTAFEGIYPFGYGCSGTICSGTSEITARYGITSASTSAKVLEAHFDRETGMRWGRWGGGVVTVGDRAGGGTGPVPTADGNGSTNVVDLTVNHWHYLLTGVQSGPVVLPVTGSASYQLIGATLPTAFAPNQSVPDVGSLTSASLSANFTAKTVNVGVSVTTPVSGAWTASASNVPILKDTAFTVSKTLSGTGNLTITRTVNGVASSANTAGQIVGGFAGPTGQGAGIAYSLNQGGGAGTTVSGVAAFKRP